jgi:hypothetical protein
MPVRRAVQTLLAVFVLAASFFSVRVVSNFPLPSRTDGLALDLPSLRDEIGIKYNVNTTERPLVLDQSDHFIDKHKEMSVAPANETNATRIPSSTQATHAGSEALKHKPQSTSTSNLLNYGFNASAMHICTNQDGETVSLPAHFPRFVVFGAQKGGTTALTEILKHHPNVMANRLAPREPHYFDFYVTKRDLPYRDPAFLCSTRERYIRDYFELDNYLRLSQNRTIFAFEKTPSYIRYVGAAYRMYQVLGRSIKLIAVLRNPVERSYSNYKMEHVRGYPMDTSFDALIQHEIEALRQAGLTQAPPLFANSTNSSDNYSFHTLNLTFQERRTIVQNSKTPQKGRLRKMKDNSIYTGMYATQLSEWLQYYELGVDVMVIATDRMSTDLDNVLRQVQEFLGLPVMEFPKSVTSKDYNPLTPFRGIRNVDKQVDRPSNETIEYLKRFYKPYNDELADLLGESWRGIWD